MTEQRGGTRRRNAGAKEPFVSREDRPEVQIDLDTPVSELRVRELSAILGYMAQKSPFEAGKTSLKDFFDKPFPEVAKDWVKEIKSEKLDKLEKFEKNEKFEKSEKIEKPERKELKHEKLEKLEKLENDLVFEQPEFPGPDPRMDQVIQAVAGLTEQVGRLTNQVAELEKKLRG